MLAHTDQADVSYKQSQAPAHNVSFELIVKRRDTRQTHSQQTVRTNKHGQVLAVLRDLSGLAPTLYIEVYTVDVHAIRR